MRRAAGLMLWGLVLATAGLPLAWLGVAWLGHPSAWGELWPDAYRLGVFGRTLDLAAAAASLAALLAVAPARALARGGRATWVLLAVMAATLGVPAVAWAYGWAEFVRGVLHVPRPGSWGDLARLVVTDAACYWPVPAATVALAWRRLPAGVLDAARLDGATRRVVLRLLVGPAVAGWCGAFLLSGQNLPAADQSGVVVASVVVRDRFTTGHGTQPERVAGAVATGLPSFAAVAGVAVAGWVAFRRSRVEDDAQQPQDSISREQSERNRGPRSLRSRLSGSVPLLVIVCLATVPPAYALLRTTGFFSLAEVWQSHSDEFTVGLGLAAFSAGVCAAFWVLATLTDWRGPLWVSLAAFLLGGQFVALGMIHAYLPSPDAPQLWGDVLGDLYDTPPFYAAAGVALYGWLCLAAGRATWGGGYRPLRDLAAADGAGAGQTALHVVWPLAWPSLVAATLATFALCFTETHASVLLVPGTPINFMMTNLHTIDYPAMAEAAVLMGLVCAAVAVASVAVVAVSVWVRQRFESRAGKATKAMPRPFPVVTRLLAVTFVALLASCDRPPAPEAVWADGGLNRGQLAYPRGICYSPADDSFWVVDKSARVSHFDAGGKYLNGWTMPEQQYGRPVGISVDDAGNVWVPDTHYFRVIVYRPDGVEWFRFGEKGTGRGQFTWPTDILVRGDRVYVSEYGSGGGDAPSDDRIQIFERSPDGTISDGPAACVAQIGRFGTGPGEFRRPQSMVLTGGKLWVADATNHRLEAFDPDTGALLSTLGGAPGSQPGQFRFPYGLDADAYGNLIVTEFGNSRVQKIDPATGAIVAAWDGGFGAKPGQFKYPWAAAYDPVRDRVVVLDSGNNRLQVLRF